MRPRIAVTVGDPRGIGPEIVRKALSKSPDGAEYIVVGPPDALGDIPSKHIAVETPCASSDSDSDAEALTAGRHVGRQLETAVSMALSHDVHAIVTGPAEKRALHLAGYHYPGYTEWLGHLAGDVDTVMMLCAGPLRVALVTTHLALRDAIVGLTQRKILRVGEMTQGALSDWWGMAQPRLALCALNPHAGEGGLFGNEERDVLEPAARELGVAGPLPADTVFLRALRGEFDAVLAPYHDVGMTAVKMSGFGKGVNVTLGLPFIRTAPDHGTAFDIAGRGIADPGSMCEAIRMAVSFATRTLETDG